MLGFDLASVLGGESKQGGGLMVADVLGDAIVIVEVRCSEGNSGRIDPPEGAEVEAAGAAAATGCDSQKSDGNVPLPLRDVRATGSAAVDLKQQQGRTAVAAGGKPASANAAAVPPQPWPWL